MSHWLRLVELIIFQPLTLYLKIVHPRKTVAYLRNNRAVSWLGIEPAIESRESYVLTTSWHRWHHNLKKFVTNYPNAIFKSVKAANLQTCRLLHTLILWQKLHVCVRCSISPRYFAVVVGKLRRGLHCTRNNLVPTSIKVALYHTSSWLSVMLSMWLIFCISVSDWVMDVLSCKRSIRCRLCLTRRCLSISKN